MKDGQKKVHRCIELRIEANALMITIFGFLVESSFFSSSFLKMMNFHFICIRIFKMKGCRRIEEKNEKENVPSLCVLMCVYMFYDDDKFISNFFFFWGGVRQEFTGWYYTGITGYILRQEKGNGNQWCNDAKCFSLKDMDWKSRASCSFSLSKWNIITARNQIQSYRNSFVFSSSSSFR